MNVSITKCEVSKGFSKCSYCKEKKEVLLFSVEAILGGKGATAEGAVCINCIELDQNKKAIVNMVLPQLLEKLQTGVIIQ